MPIALLCGKIRYSSASDQLGKDTVTTTKKVHINIQTTRREFEKDASSLAEYTIPAP